MKKIKRYFVKRWFHLLTEKELEDIKFKRNIDRAYERIASAMIDTFKEKS